MTNEFWGDFPFVGRDRRRGATVTVTVTDDDRPDHQTSPPARCPQPADGSRNGSMYVWTDAYPRGTGTGGANFTAWFAVLPGEGEARVDIRALVDFSSVE